MPIRRELEFGVFLDPSADELADTRATAELADRLGLDLIGIQDHPYQRRFLDTFALIADLLARTERIRVFPDVANLPLRGPAMLAKAAASLDVLSGGRFELGLGAGGFWPAIAAMGGPVREGPERLRSLEEAVEIIRRALDGERGLTVEGDVYRVKGFQPGPPPAHRVGIWLGVQQARPIDLVGRVADGWICSMAYVPPATVRAGNDRIDRAALAAGRDPASIRRVYNVNGVIADGPASAVLQGPPEHWIEVLGELADTYGIDTFVMWPGDDPLDQVGRFAREVVPALRRSASPGAT
jgi:alkanesulfonate monooxygenase SsuD/methylene tetrahydromethanopterin reductase-like flavin-dependent oxidoreductase (luciferase family)